jgi:diadenosine tetraphosphate (Ap4A) HIT family hydrolase
MDKQCDACGFLKNPSPETQILDTKYWSVGIDGHNHAYLGRAYVTLKEHKANLSSLSQDEWADFQEIVRKLEKAYKSAFGAEPLNWGCFMNHAFRTKPFNSHVHWHIFPRYEVAPVLDCITFDDSLFGEFYDNNAERPVSAETVEHIASTLRQHIG